MAMARHVKRLALLSAVAALLLGWLGAHTDILFADGLRYIGQAQGYASGGGPGALKGAVDHPVYPLAIAATHRVLGGDRPDDWQRAAQVASILAGVLLVLPLYLVARELFGDDAAFAGTLLVYLVPLTGHVFADTLSESTFLLFWAWGLWGALRFLKTGAIGWVPLIVLGSALSYLTRPEGLLLPAALVAALVLSPRWVARGLGRRGLIALALLVIGSAATVGPYVLLKGGLGTKPSIARLLGTAPRSAPNAVERLRPLDPNQSAAGTLLLAAKGVFKATTEAVTWPVFPLAVVGLAIFALRCRGREERARQGRLVGVIVAASLLALIRLHATGGYCSPRHAMIVSLMAIPAGAFGLMESLRRVAGRLAARVPVACLGWAAALGVLLVMNGAQLVAPVNEGFDGYRQAAQWLDEHSAGGKVVDVTGWTQFYSGRDGYTFENLVAAYNDPSARWVVLRKAHLKGPWEYCQRLRALVDGVTPVIIFRGSARHQPTRVAIFDRQPLIDRIAAARAQDAARR